MDLFKVFLKQSHLSFFSSKIIQRPSSDGIQLHVKHALMTISPSHITQRILRKGGGNNDFNITKTRESEMIIGLFKKKML